MTRLRVRVRGTVQGVGFRPHVWRLATALGLTGTVLQRRRGRAGRGAGRAGGGIRARRSRRQARRRWRASPRSRSRAVPPRRRRGRLRHPRQRRRPGGDLGAPDACVCPACLAEMCDPADRRWRYPFLNCTQCGPRFTITRRLPYDRANTAMAGFRAVPGLRGANTPTPPTAASMPSRSPARHCGPRLSHPIADVLAALRARADRGAEGARAASTCCATPTDAAAVERLRARKERGGKPFAVMALNAASVERWAAPARRSGRRWNRSSGRSCCWQRRAGLPDALAPGLDTLGVMLPAAPLHYLLFHEAAGRPGGHRLAGGCERPAAGGHQRQSRRRAAGDRRRRGRARLGGIADLVVTHDRAVVTRCDDSVVRVIDGGAALPAPRPRLHARAPSRWPARCRRCWRWAAC